MRARNVSWLTLALGLWLAATAGAAPQPGAQPEAPFGEQIDVRVVNVEVVVTDAAGQRVPDLAAGDFRLRVAAGRCAPRCRRWAAGAADADRGMMSGAWGIAPSRGTGLLFVAGADPPQNRDNLIGGKTKGNSRDVERRFRRLDRRDLELTAIRPLDSNRTVGPGVVQNLGQLLPGLGEGTDGHDGTSRTRRPALNAACFCPASRVNSGAPWSNPQWMTYAS
jgi:hypothetical protein